MADDALGLRHAPADRLLPFVVAAMAFMAALALAGTMAASSLAQTWQQGAAAIMTVQVPDPDAVAGTTTRAESVQAALRITPGITSVRRLTDQELGGLLRPWLGDDPALLAVKFPALFEIGVTQAVDAASLATRLTQAAPGTRVERNGDWLRRLRALITSLQAGAALVLVLVTGTSAAMVAVITRAALASRHEAIDILHGLGATDGLIAGQFAVRMAVLALAGGLLGVLLAIPMLFGLAILAAPFTPAAPAPTPAPMDVLPVLPAGLWAAFPLLALAAGLIGWITAQIAVRLWLARLP